MGQASATRGATGHSDTSLPAKSCGCWDPSGLQLASPRCRRTRPGQGPIKAGFFFEAETRNRFLGHEVSTGGGQPAGGTAGPRAAASLPPLPGLPSGREEHPVFTQMCARRNVCRRVAHRQLIPQPPTTASLFPSPRRQLRGLGAERGRGQEPGPCGLQDRSCFPDMPRAVVVGEPGPQWAHVGGPPRAGSGKAGGDRANEQAEGCRHFPRHGPRWEGTCGHHPTEDRSCDTGATLSRSSPAPPP